MAKSKQKPKHAMTGAERQAAYRKRRKAGRFGSPGADDRELRAWITYDAFLALARQARHYGVTKREMLERVIGDGQDKTLEKIKGTPAQDTYWKVLRSSCRV
jgi:hypothetical protein